MLPGDNTFPSYLAGEYFPSISLLLYSLKNIKNIKVIKSININKIDLETFLKSLIFCVLLIINNNNNITWYQVLIFIE